ncbi:MAG: hypothetical protein MJA83_09765, partial [Gammaproteobacteria bacterium]|nr:hypothetical protein [Gammaproteobacteria bacterium]
KDAFANDELHNRVVEAIDLFKEKDSSIENYFDNAYGYAVFPKVGKGGLGVGGAHGRGEVYEKDKLVGTARLTQVTIGFQAGGQVYAEVIFFKDKKALDDFKASKLKLSAQATAVAAAAGASANAAYSHGIMIFTVAKAGLMYEASIGGQKFKFKPLT